MSLKLNGDSMLGVQVGDLAGIMKLMQDPWNQNVSDAALACFLVDLVEDGILPVVKA